jgi:molybdopterin-guanine dinucleotide biosynthesis protein A
MTELAETLSRIANQADSAAAEADSSSVTGTPVKYSEALARTIEDLLGEIRSKLSKSE